MTRKVVVPHPCVRGQVIDIYEDRGPRKVRKNSVITGRGMNPIRYLYVPAYLWRR